MSETSFVCDECGTVDLVCITPKQNGRWLCAECATGSWHGIFQKEKYDPSKHKNVTNRSNGDSEYSCS